MLSDETIDFLLDFIKVGENFPKDTEISVYHKRRLGFVRQLQKIQDDLNPQQILKLKDALKEQYFKALITPGECVGILASQSIGEHTTQATLNTFHVAGINVDTGSPRFQELLNASKVIKRQNVYLQFKGRSLNEETLCQMLTYIEFKDIVVEYSQIENIPDDFLPCRLLYGVKKVTGKVYKVNLSLRLLYKYRIKQSFLKLKLDTLTTECLFVPFTSLDAHQTIIPFIIITTTLFEDLLGTPLFGIPHITEHFYTPTMVTAYNTTIRNILINSSLELTTLIDLDKINTNTVWEIYHIFGIEAAKQYLIDEFVKVVEDNVCIAHIKLLVNRMTHTGVIEPMTRYTLRSDEGPLSKASFEESYETLIKAAKFKETDHLQGVSASVMVGKKPSVGTYCFDLFMDINKF